MLWLLSKTLLISLFLMKRLPGRKVWLFRKRSWFNVIPWGKLIVKFPMGYIVKNLDCDVLLQSMIYNNKSKNRWLFIAEKKLSDFFFLLIAEIEIVRLLSRLWFLRVLPKGTAAFYSIGSLLKKTSLKLLS